MRQQTPNAQQVNVTTVSFETQSDYEEDMIETFNQYLLASFCSTGLQAKETWKIKQTTQSRWVGGLTLRKFCSLSCRCKEGRLCNTNADFKSYIFQNLMWIEQNRTVYQTDKNNINYNSFYCSLRSYIRTLTEHFISNICEI